MDVEMEHRLSRARTHVKHRAVSLLNVSLTRNLGRHQMTAAYYRGVLRLRFVQSGKMFSWDDQHMGGRLWIDVFKGKDMIVLIDFLRGNLAAENAAEKAVTANVGHGEDSGVSIALTLQKWPVVAG
jgi:hypothetical protein